MMKSISKAAKDGIPIYGECGGLMYLTRSIRGYKCDNDNNNKKRKIIGLIDADTIMTGKLTMNYTDADSNASIFGKISKIRGHEFHYSKIENISKDSKFAYIMKRGSGIDNKKMVLLYTTVWHHICTFTSQIADCQRDLLKNVSNVHKDNFTIM